MGRAWKAMGAIVPHAVRVRHVTGREAQRCLRDGQKRSVVRDFCEVVRCMSPQHTYGNLM